MLATGGSLKAAEDLIAQIEGAEVVASFCVFDVPPLLGRYNLTHKHVSIAEMPALAGGGNEYFDWRSAPSVLRSIDFEEPEGGLYATPAIALTVAKKEAVSHDTYMYELEFPDPEWILGLWPGGHMNLH